MFTVLLILYYLPLNLVLFYFIFNYFVALYTFWNCTKFYFPHMKFRKEEIENFEKNKTSEKFMNQYFHENYKSFQRKELSSISLGWIYYGALNYLWIKLSFMIFSLFCIWLALKIKIGGKSNMASKEEREYILKVNRILGKAFYLSLGTNMTEIDLREDHKTKSVYKKYLGENYDFHGHEDNFSTVISNHFSYVEPQYFLYKFSPSYVSKSSAKKAPLVGKIGEVLNNFWIDRTSKNNRFEIIEKIEERQRLTMDKKCLNPLCLFPEGTTTNAKTIISFKKGAFYSLTPIKIFYFEVDLRKNYFSIATAGMDMMIHIILYCTFLKHDLNVYEMPVFAPNDYLFENYKHLGKDKAEIFSEACRRVLSEISGFQLSNSTWDQKLQYITKIVGKEIKNT